MSPLARTLITVSFLANALLLVIVGALADPLDIGDKAMVYSTPTVFPLPTASRPAYQFPPNSNEPVNGSLQCPDAGSIAAGKGDDKTEILQIKGVREKPVMVLGPNRRVIIAEGAVMSGPVIVCGDGGTVLIIGTQAGPVVMRGSGPKIVVQDGDASKLPPAYSMTNGTALRCTTLNADPDTPSCDNYTPRPGAKPNG